MKHEQTWLPKYNDRLFKFLHRFCVCVIQFLSFFLNVQRNSHFLLIYSIKRSKAQVYVRSFLAFLSNVARKLFAMKCFVYSCMRYKISRINRPEEKRTPHMNYNCSLQFASVQKVYIRMEIVERLSSLFFVLISAELHSRRRVGRFFVLFFFVVFFLCFFLINIAFTL